ncbi:hypothetical protein H5392_05700 [Tessaracoccus sp. MC1865]|uniref:Rv3235 family protein n=1 Tax=Tessaracoccus sp. MC1865 TaxID=2760310 RepID=UPI001600342F|nr:Rv3235 family protein [Tessaracoccus sp. MC1865]MBB1483355.1 hypothetical protein [Tessaracoccus sp. MC1865]QTO36471.1 hypothetical protein J7D54_08075 [Tessaracoccus sp. MC1865]
MNPSSITPLRPSPAPQQAPPQAVRLIHVLLEAMAGRRALHQVRPLLSPTSFIRLASYADAGLFRRMAIGPLKTQMPTPRAVEATVSLLCASRVISCAIRLDVHRDRWVCTELAVLRPAAMMAA